DAYVMQIVQLVKDSVPEKKIVISVTSPGFTGSGAPNTAFLRIMLEQPDDRERSQQQIADMLNQNLRRNTMGRAFIIQEPTISSGGIGRGQPIQFVIQNTDFEKIRSVLPEFMDK